MEAGLRKQKEMSLAWNPKEEEAFQRLNELLICALSWCTQTLIGGFHTISWWKPERSGGSAAQCPRYERKRIIAYASRIPKDRKNNPMNYSPFKLQLLAVVWAVTEKLAEFFMRTELKLLTGNNPLGLFEHCPAGHSKTSRVSQAGRAQIWYQPCCSNGKREILPHSPVEVARGPISEETETPNVMAVEREVLQAYLQMGGWNCPRWNTSREPGDQVVSWQMTGQSTTR